MNLFSALGLGFLLGLRHATDADHVVAMNAIVSKQQNLRLAAGVGLMWGVGHSLMVIFVGIAVIVFHWIIPDVLAKVFEGIVAVMLIGIGIRHILDNPIHDHEYHHNYFIRPFIIGLVHGLAGTAAITILIVSTITNVYVAFWYLVLFGIGTMVGMMMVTMFMSAVMGYVKILGKIAGWMSLLFGLYIFHELTQKLF